jgi:hypothetical protein
MEMKQKCLFARQLKVISAPTWTMLQIVEHGARES